MLTGSLNELNEQLSQLVYTPSTNYSGADSLVISVTDQGNTGAGSALSDATTVELTVVPVNDAPVLSAPSQLSMQEDTSSLVEGLQISDVDGEGSEFVVRLSVAQGELQLEDTEGISIDAQTADALEFKGTLDAVNRALQGLRYQGLENFAGIDVLLFEVSDMGSAEGDAVLTSARTVAIVVVPVNDLPEIAAPTNLVVLEDTDYSFENLIVVSDVDAETLSVELSVEQGQLFLGDDTQGGSALSIEGMASEINAQLSSVVYRGQTDFFGLDSLRVTVSDGEGVQEKAIAVSVIPVNDRPTINAPTSLAFVEDSAAAIDQIQISDVDIEEGDAEVTLSVSNGYLRLAAV